MKIHLIYYVSHLVYELLPGVGTLLEKNIEIHKMFLFQCSVLTVGAGAALHKLQMYSPLQRSLAISRTQHNSRQKFQLHLIQCNSVQLGISLEKDGSRSDPRPPRIQLRRDPRVPDVYVTVDTEHGAPEGDTLEIPCQETS